MDPNVALRQLRDNTERLRQLLDEQELDTDFSATVQEVVTGFSDLDDWLTNKKVFPPRDWDRVPTVVAELEAELNTHPTWRSPLELP